MKVRRILLVLTGLLALTLFPVHSEIVECLTTYKMHIGEKTKKIRLTILIPQTIEQVQTIHGVKYSRPATSIYQSNGDQYAEFMIDSEKGDVTIGISVLIELFSHDLSTVKDGANVSMGIPEDYLTAEKYIEKDNDLIKTWKTRLTQKDTLKTIRNIYNYVSRTMKYKLNMTSQKGAAKALEDLTGDCTEFTDLFVALCRSSSIPCIAAYGYVTTYSTSPKHSWAEVYCSPYGWIRVDPTPGNMNTLKKLRNGYIQFSTQRNDRTLNGYFYKYAYWGDPVKIVDEIRIRTF